ncbi:MAG: prepilin-type N-terminal cleavage/methylation domain-containing protein [Candidatus Gastranaerophilales bacterium]|nr:prepilin-type N-terminal cleavage/methylation domain-containing protein [Candidatus Gastranaerophilales bacterium]
MLFTKKGFTLVEMMVAMLLSAIVIFFSYTMTVSAHKMFAKVSNTSNNFNNTQFFEEFFKSTLMNAYKIEISEDGIACRIYDPMAGKKYQNNYSFNNQKGDGNSVQFKTQHGSHYDSVFNNIPIGKSANLIVRNQGAGHKIDNTILLSNVRAFYYRVDKIGAGPGAPNNFRNITIGIVYDDYIVPGVPKRKYKTFCFTIKNKVELTYPTT